VGYADYNSTGRRAEAFGDDRRNFNNDDSSRARFPFMWVRAKNNGSQEAGKRLAGRPKATRIENRRTVKPTPRQRPHQRSFEEEIMMTVYVEEIELNVEEMEAVIAPGLTNNHNETLDVDLSVEEMEEVIAPALTNNHNETLDVDLSVEEMEEVIAPALQPNHNETLVSDAQ
jgi:hypothetical protein